MDKFLLIVSAVVLSVGASLFMIKTMEVAAPQFGANPGGDFYTPVEFYDGQINAGSVATTSQGNVTVTAAEFRRWVKSGLVSHAPGLLAGATITLPASSTIPDVVPQAGDRARFCVQNSTSTANVALTFAGGVGTKFVVASSSATALGSTKLFTGKIGCFDIIREVATSSAFDIDVLFTTYQ